METIEYQPQLLNVGCRDYVGKDHACDYQFLEEEGVIAGNRGEIGTHV